MQNKRRSLTSDELADAERLRKVWVEKSKKLNLTQLDAAQSFGFANQSAISQYLNAKIPLNLEAALRFAAILKVPVAEISRKYDELLDADRNHGRRRTIGIPEEDDLVEVTDAMKEVVGDFTWLVIDKAQKRLSNGLFAVQMGESITVIESKLVDGVFHIQGSSSTAMKIPVESAMLLSIIGKVTHKIFKC